MKMPTILLVDDEPGQRENIRSYLEPRIDCNIAEASNAEEAINFIKNQLPLNMTNPEIQSLFKKPSNEKEINKFDSLIREILHKINIIEEMVIEKKKQSEHSDIARTYNILLNLLIGLVSENSILKNYFCWNT